MMRRYLYPPLLVWCGFFVMISLGIAGAPPSADSEPSGFKGTVAAHNVWRQAVSAPDMAWSNTLAATAQEWANFLASPKGGCRLEHRPRKGKHARPFGENLYQAFSSPKPPQLSPKEVVDAWGGESENYDANTHTCSPGKVCGHYTQMVWRDTRFVGCGMTACQTNNFHAIIWVCNYDPYGNIVGQYPF